MTMIIVRAAFPQQARILRALPDTRCLAWKVGFALSAAGRPDHEDQHPQEAMTKITGIIDNAQSLIYYKVLGLLLTKYPTT